MYFPQVKSKGWGRWLLLEIYSPRFICLPLKSINTVFYIINFKQKKDGKNRRTSSKEIRQDRYLGNLDVIQLRKRLVQEVIEEERSLSKTAQKLGIKLSTAKVIIKRFKEEGTFFQKKKDKEIRNNEAPISHDRI